MAFFKFRQRGQPAAEAPARSRGKSSAATPEETVDTLRRRARYRLAGAAVLVLAAVVGFPLIFDTQPRPVAVDVPITIPDKHSAAPLKLPEPVPAAASLDEREEVVADGASRSQSGPPSAAHASTPPADARASAAPAPRDSDAKSQEAAAKARRDEAERSKREAEARARREQQAETSRAQRDEVRAAQARREDGADARAAAAAEAKAKRDEARRDEAAKREQQARDKREADQRAQRDEAARARALLEGRGDGAGADKPKADAGKGRFMVQVGAFADDAAVRQARQKAESAGVKTYTQVVNTRAGPRTRVRVGPYGSRAEAEKAAAVLKKAGLPGAIVSF